MPGPDGRGGTSSGDSFDDITLANNIGAAVGNDNMIINLVNPSGKELETLIARVGEKGSSARDVDALVMEAILAQQDGSSTLLDFLDRQGEAVQRGELEIKVDPATGNLQYHRAADAPPIDWPGEFMKALKGVEEANERALECLKRAQELDPTNIDVMNRIAFIIKRDDPQGARRLILKVTAIIGHPGTEEEKYQLGLAKFYMAEILQEDFPAEARTYYSDARKRFEESGNPDWTRLCDRALSKLGSSVPKGPPTPQEVRGGGPAVELSIGEPTDEMKEELLKILAEDPDDELARDLYEMLFGD